MESKNNVLIVGIAALLIGLGGGYLMAGGGTTTPQTAEQGSSNDMMANLKSKTGAAFEKSFIVEMTAHHQSAVDMAGLIPSRTNRPELIKLGKDIISAQTSEIQMMQQWKSQWFGQSGNSNDTAESGSMTH